AAERDQMKALLNLNEAGRIQELIDQNMGLAKKLRVATEKMDILHRDNESTKDELLDALNDLVVAKSQINRLKQERAAQETRLAELKARLRREEHALANGLIAADPAEIATLRNIIKRQLLIQERRHQATEILLEAAKQLGAGNQNVSDAIAILEGPELQLTPEEQAIVAGRADADLFSPFALDPERANQNHNAQARDIASFDRAATKAFASDRYLSAREIFELIVEQNPGHVSSLCKLGVVNLKLDDPLAAADTFRRAVELDPNNPYAHRMLGFAIYTQGDIEGAEPSVRKAVELAQDDHNSQKLLGVIYYRLGRSKDSERHFKAAITADPMPSEPYFNLAMLCARDKRLNDARSYYQQALERGAIPDPNLEKTLSAH
ncbi:MAG: tetratricopeptide repeat protein, partial [Akkermansiaceae bacterium]|nr:tetratricopeptide repeat protein [Akkermansiaceae bacterium]